MAYIPETLVKNTKNPYKSLMSLGCHVYGFTGIIKHEIITHKIARVSIVQNFTTRNTSGGLIGGLLAWLVMGPAALLLNTERYNLEVELVVYFNDGTPPQQLRTSDKRLLRTLDRFMYADKRKQVNRFYKDW